MSGIFIGILGAVLFIGMIFGLVWFGLRSCREEDDTEKLLRKWREGK